MKSFFSFALASLLSVIFASASSAAIVATDDFYYANGNLNGQNGGTGWTSAWAATSGAESVASNVLTFTGNNNDAAIRSFAAQSGNDLYFSFTLKFAGAFGPNDFLGFWADNGTSTGSHTANVPNMGIKANQGPGSSDYFVRYNIGGELYSPTQAVLGNTVQLIGHLEKVAGSFRKFSLWVNTTPGVLATPLPQAVANSASGYTSISRIGFRTVNLDSTPVPTRDVLSVDDLRVATTLEDVLSIPEPATMAIWGSLGLAGLVAGYRRRKSS